MVEAKFANRELNSFARSAIEVVLLPLFDWLIVVIGVTEVVGDTLTVMESLLSGDLSNGGRASSVPTQKSSYLS